MTEESKADPNGTLEQQLRDLSDHMLTASRRPADQDAAALKKLFAKTDGDASPAD